MKKIVLAPDSFKGTLSAEDVCRIEEQVIRRYLPDAEIKAIPMADGGEGMVNALLNVLPGKRVTAQVRAPLGGSVQADYGILEDGSAVIEMAAAAGLPLVLGREDPLHASTYGVGELIVHARRQGVKKVLLGLGGSCTNDCGIGMAAALGFRFLDARGRELEPVAANLEQIEEIREPEKSLGLEICAACDVNNPLTGPRGATYTFGPQKGAGEQVLEQMERGMIHFEQVMARHYGKSCDPVPGAGAAGGMGAAILMLVKGTLRPGIDLMLDAVSFDELVRNADLVFTGEGRIDWQSANGKVLSGIGLRCRKAGVPCIALCGSVGKDADRMYSCGISAIFSAVKGAATFEEVRMTSEADLGFLMDSVMRVLQLRG